MDFDIRRDQAQAYTAHCATKLREKRAAGESAPEGQKFKAGTKVHIAKDLGRSMSHFASDCDALVQYTYAEMFGGDINIDSYSLMLLDNDGRELYSSAWYHEHQLTEVT